MTSRKQLEREITAALGPAVGDRFDSFGTISRVLKVRRNKNGLITKVVTATELPDPRDRFEKTVLVDQREVHPSALAHMKKLP